jgi:hypothetical protein
MSENLYGDCSRNYRRRSLSAHAETALRTWRTKDTRTFWSSYITTENKNRQNHNYSTIRLKINNIYEYIFTKCKMSSPNGFCSVPCLTHRAPLPERCGRFGQTWVMALKYAVALPPERRFGDWFNDMSRAIFQKSVYNKACHFSAPHISYPREQFVQWLQLNMVIPQPTLNKHFPEVRYI